MIKLRDIDDPFFDKEADHYEELHGRPHPLRPYKRFVDQMVLHGLRVDLNEFDFVVHQTVRVWSDERYLDVTRRAIEEYGDETVKAAVGRLRGAVQKVAS